MIRFLRGKVLEKNVSEVVVDVNGVGYGVLVDAHTVEAATVGDDVQYYIYSHVREQEFSLYGFISRIEREMFELLISVSGIGPKAALNILSVADVSAIAASIAHKDVSILTSVSGVGKKTAEKVVVELQGRIDHFSTQDAEAAMLDTSAIDALKSMGYSIGEARDALSYVDKDVKDVSERIKLALKNLGK